MTPTNLTKDSNKTTRKELHIAPMLDVSKPEFLNLMRILTKRAIIWTEMVVDETIAHTDDIHRHLGFIRTSEGETFGNEKKRRRCDDRFLNPIVCQIGGRDEDYSARAARIVEEYGYNEVNLNIDCPSNRVSGKRQFGAVLMKQADTAVLVVSAMNSTTTRIPVSVKTRIGIDDFDTIEYLFRFIERLRNEAGCRKFVIHARKCVLGGLLTPAQNRIVPPLNYPRVYKLCHRFPDCSFVLNGGVPGLQAAKNICFGSLAPPYNKPMTMQNKELIGNVIHDSGSNRCSILEPSGHCQEKIIDERSTNDDHENEQHQHAVPCSLCKASNGSCTAPPLLAPDNLTGCMLGRAAMDNPSMFWDVDRYFYGESVNPCRNRKEALEKYCQYLEKIYPRRCCDRDDDIITVRIPAPAVTTIGSGGCPTCQEFYGPPSSSLSHTPSSLSLNKNGTIKAKISSKVIDRSLKPILGLFFGLPKSKKFRRECDKLSRNAAVRNCGPGYIIRKAMQCMPEDILSQDFIRTEHLDDHAMTVHVAPIMQ